MSIKTTICVLLLSTGAVLSSCGKSSDAKKNEAELNTGNETETDGIDTEMDSVVSPDTIMPAP